MSDIYYLNAKLKNGKRTRDVRTFCTITEFLVPSNPEPTIKFQKISMGVGYSSAITEFGSLYTWGDNEYGQLGDGTTADKYVPTLINSFDGEKVIAVDLGQDHSAAITETGKLYTWGHNQHGQLGNGNTYNRTTPTLIDSFNGEKVIAISLGGYTSAAITESGKLYMWGENDYGQLGNGLTIDRSFPLWINRFNGEKIVTVSLGSGHSSAITESGKLYTWGDNDFGQLGDGTTVEKHTPRLIDRFNGEKVIAVSLGVEHSAAITESGKLYTWGYNYYGQLGNGSTDERHIPTCIISGKKVVDVSLGWAHSAALIESGELYTWGSNSEGKLGDGTTIPKHYPILIDMFGGEKVVAISISDHHSAAITETGKLYTWGNNFYGQLGIGPTSSRSVPTNVIVSTTHHL